MLNDMIIDSAKELAEDNALWIKMQDFDIVHRVSQMVQEHLTDSDKYGMLAIGAYRYFERECWKTHDVVCELEAALVS